jgi:hypothetical protein
MAAHPTPHPEDIVTGKTLAAMAAEIRTLNIDKGWRQPDGSPGERTWGDYIALIHTEIGEATDAYRRWLLNDATEVYDCPPEGCHGKPDCSDGHTPAKPEGVGPELADVLIRTIDTADAFDRVPDIGTRSLADLEPLVASSDEPPVVSFPEHMAFLHHLTAELWTSWSQGGSWQRINILLLLSALHTIADSHGLDLNAEYERKMNHNRTRPHRHGGKHL